VNVHQALQGNIGRDGCVVPIHRLRHFVAGQHIVERQLLHLSLGGTFQEPADEGDPHAVHEVAGKHLPHTQPDEEKGDESPQIGGDQGGPTQIVGDAPYGRPKDAAAIQGKPGIRLNRPSMRLI